MFLSYSKPKRWLLFFQITVSVLAIFYVVYKIISFAYWNDFFIWINNNIKSFLWLIAIQLCLSFINISVETLRWRLLTSLLEKQKFFDSMRQVLYGILIGMITPAKLGEPVGKSLLLRKGNRYRGIILSFTGSLFQNFVIIAVGILALIILKHNYIRFIELFPILSEKILFYILIISILIILVVFALLKLYFLKQKKGLIRKLSFYLQILKKITIKKLINLLLLTILRYIIFSFQFLLVLTFLDILVTPMQFWLIPFYYLIITFLPAIALADLGVRSSAALIVFGVFCNNSAAIISATFIIWFFNLVLPAFSNLFFNFSPKKHYFLK